MKHVLVRILRYLGLALVLGTVAVGPYPQGLFFPYQQYIAESAIALGFLVWSVSLRLEGRRMRFLVDWVEIAGLGLLGCYLLASFTAVYPQGHLNVILQIAAGLMTFYVVREESQSFPALSKWIGWLMIAASVGVVILGLAPYIGMEIQDQTILDAMALVRLRKRLTSTFEYWNTYAAYAVTMWVILTGLVLGSRWRAILLPLAGVLGSLYAVTFLLAASRGALLVLPIALVLLFLALPRGQKFGGVLFMVGTFVIGLAIVKGVDGNADLSDWPRVWKWLGAGAAAGAMGGALLLGWLMLARKWQLVLTAMAAVGIMIGTGVVINQHGSIATTAEALLPDTARRLTDMNWRTQNAIVRLAYNTDALRIVRDRPLLGAGGRGYERLYTQYQDFRYVSSEVHNHYLQVAVEAGLPAMLIFLSLWIPVAWRFIRHRYTADSQLLIAAVLVIAAHSVLDFNLSYLSIWLLVFAALGTSTHNAEPPRWLNADRSVPAGLLACMAGLLLVISTAHATGSYYLKFGTSYIEAGSKEEAIPPLQRAQKLMPLSPDPLTQLAEAYIGTSLETASLTQAIQLDPHNHERHRTLKVALLRHEDELGAYTAAREALRLQPTLQTYYQDALDVGAVIAIRAVLDEQNADAGNVVDDVADLITQLEAKRQKAATTESLWPLASPNYSRLMRLRAGQILALTQQYDDALAHLVQARKQSTLMAEAEIWMYLIYQQQGKVTEQQRLEDRAWIRFIHINPIRTVLQRAEALHK